MEHIFTKLTHKLRGGIKCLRENGLRYTMKRVLVHLGLAEEPKPKPKPKQPPKQQKPKEVKKNYKYYEQLPPEKYEEELKLWFLQKTGTELDLENPKTFNEKIQWLKLYDSTPLKTRLADKYLVRDWIKEKIGEEYLVPLLGVWDSFDEIDFDKLPEQFVLKANHGCGWNIIVKDKYQLDREEAKRKFDSWMQINYAFRVGLELQYMNIPPKIMAEKFLGEDVPDYKFMCFNGKVKSIRVNSERFTSHKLTVFTKEWERIPVTIGNYPPADYDIPCPENLDEMIRLSEILSRSFAHVRVDFYNVFGHIYFGEMTFTSGSGITKRQPEEFGRKMGDWLHLPPKSPFLERLF